MEWWFSDARSDWVINVDGDWAQVRRWLQQVTGAEPIAALKRQAETRICTLEIQTKEVREEEDQWKLAEYIFCYVSGNSLVHCRESRGRIPSAARGSDA